jgi:hypothetical protein
MRKARLAIVLGMMLLCASQMSYADFFDGFEEDGPLIGWSRDPADSGSHQSYWNGIWPYSGTLFNGVVQDSSNYSYLTKNFTAQTGTVTGYVNVADYVGNGGIAGIFIHNASTTAQIFIRDGVVWWRLGSNWYNGGNAAAAGVWHRIDFVVTSNGTLGFFDGNLLFNYASMTQVTQVHFGSIYAPTAAAGYDDISLSPSIQMYYNGTGYDANLADGRNSILNSQGIWYDRMTRRLGPTTGKWGLQLEMWDTDTNPATYTHPGSIGLRKLWDGSGQKCIDRFVIDYGTPVIGVVPWAVGLWGKFIINGQVQWLPVNDMNYGYLDFWPIDRTTTLTNGDFIWNGRKLTPAEFSSIHGVELRLIGGGGIYSSDNPAVWGGGDPMAVVLNGTTLLPFTFENIWYDNLNAHTDPVGIYNMSSPTALPYNFEYCNPDDPSQVARVQLYLDNAQGRGMQVILSCKEALVKAWDGRMTWTQFTNYINLFKDHPALKGWYILDEPIDVGIPATTCEYAYNIIRQNTHKPVYAAFYSKDLSKNAPYNYRNAYDIMLYDHYPFDTGEGQFSGLANWKTETTNAINAAASANRPFINILQGYGKISGISNKRLPTYAEERFMMFWSIIKGCRGLSYWCDDLLERSEAVIGAPYPYSGMTWKTNVGLLIGQESTALTPALSHGAVLNGVIDNHASILCNVYKDPDTGLYHLIIVNESGNNAFVDITLTLPVRIISATPQYSAHFVKYPSYYGSFSDTLTPYDVHHYLLSE